MKLFKVDTIPWNKNRPWSEEVKQRISENRKGKRAWNKGIPCSNETKIKISESLKKSFQNGRITWNKGKLLSENHKWNISKNRSELKIFI